MQPACAVDQSDEAGARRLVHLRPALIDEEIDVEQPLVEGLVGAEFVVVEPEDGTLNREPVRGRPRLDRLEDRHQIDVLLVRIEPLDLQEIALRVHRHEAVVRLALPVVELGAYLDPLPRQVRPPLLDLFGHDGERHALRLVGRVHPLLRVDERQERVVRDPEDLREAVVGHRFQAEDFRVERPRGLNVPVVVEGVEAEHRRGRRVGGRAFGIRGHGILQRRVGVTVGRGSRGQGTNSQEREKPTSVVRNMNDHRAWAGRGHGPSAILRFRPVRHNSTSTEPGPGAALLCSPTVPGPTHRCCAS